MTLPVDVDALLKAREALVGVSERKLLDALCRLVQTFSRGAWFSMAVGVLQAIWPDRHAEEALYRAFRPFSRRAIIQMLRLGRQPQAEVRSAPTGLPWFVVAVLAGPIPGLVVNVVLWSLAARMPVVLLPSRRYPGFATLMARAAEGVFTDFKGIVQAVVAPKEVSEVVELLRAAPVVVAYGGDRTFQSIVETRGDKPTFGGGHKESVVILAGGLGRQRLRMLAQAVAREVAIYDQAGCLSPHVVLCRLPDGDSLYFARRLFAELERLESTLPRGAMGLEQAAAVRAFFEESSFLARAGKATVFAPEGTVIPAVVHSSELAYRPGPGGRVVQVLDLPERLSDRIGILAGRVQALGFAGSREELDRLLEAEPDFKPCLVTTPGRMQSPPAIWPENGIVLTAELARLASSLAA